MRFTGYIFQLGAVFSLGLGSVGCWAADPVNFGPDDCRRYIQTTSRRYQIKLANKRKYQNFSPYEREIFSERLAHYQLLDRQLDKLQAEEVFFERLWKWTQKQYARELRSAPRELTDQQQAGYARESAMSMLAQKGRNAQEHPESGVQYSPTKAYFGNSRLTWTRLHILRNVLAVEWALLVYQERFYGGLVDLVRVDGIAPRRNRAQTFAAASFAVVPRSWWLDSQGNWGESYDPGEDKTVLDFLDESNPRLVIAPRGHLRMIYEPEPRAYPAIIKAHEIVGDLRYPKPIRDVIASYLDFMERNHHLPPVNVFIDLVETVSDW